MVGLNGPTRSSQESILKAFKRGDPRGSGLIEREHICQVLAKLDAAFWTAGRLETLLSAFGEDSAIRYEDFLQWLFHGTKAVAAHGAAPSPGTSDASKFTLMTFNVEEYYHGYSSKSGSGQLKDGGGDEEDSDGDTMNSGNGRGTCDAEVKDCVFETVKGIRQILEEHRPDVLCLEEHSLGSGFSEKDIMDALIGDLGYEYVSEPTGEERAWYSGLANAVVWKGSHFKLKRSWRVELTGKSESVPGATNKYTPRSAACAELQHLASGQSLVVCATHLLGGRFEDTTFVAEAIAGRSMRSEQVRKIAESIKGTCGDGARSIVAGDFNVMRDGYSQGSPFRRDAESYFHGKLLGSALGMSKCKPKPKKEDYAFDAFYVPFQRKVHETLSQELGYSVAYGRSDGVPEMKTTHYSGCIDWIYIRNLRSLRDERVISAIDEELSDHNAVMVTLQLD